MIVRGTEGGRSWSELARLDPLAAVLDSDDTRGAKNRAIDRVHKYALGRTLRAVRGRDALDFGCGTGRLSDWLVRRGASVTGVDVTPEMIEVARRRAPRAQYYAIDGTRMPFEDSSFDVVIAAYVLQYYVPDHAVLSELRRVLRTGGRLIAIEQVTEDEIGRGGSARNYELMFSESGLHLREARMIRASASRVVGLVNRYPMLSHLPLLPRMIAWEAATLSGQPLTDGRYADYAFVANRGD